jgi:metal-responsive CopG/Arc/MetJ family transcriptional regulator
MRVKTSITLSADLLKRIDRTTGRGGSRSETIERLLQESLATRARRAADARDRAIIDQHADSLNAEIDDVLKYQADL